MTGLKTAPAKGRHAAGHGRVADHGGDGHGIRRYAVEVVDRPVDRVDDPGDAGGAGRSPVLLAEDSVVGTRLAQPRQEVVLRGLVHRGDDVRGGRLRRGDLDGVGPLVDDETAGGAGDVGGERLEGGRERCRREA